MVHLRLEILRKAYYSTATIKERQRTNGDDEMAKLTNAERLIVIKKIEGMMAAQIKKETGAVVELTCRSGNKWTMNGAPSDAEKAMEWFVSTGTATEDDRILDDDGDLEGELFIYFTTDSSKANAIGNAK